MNRVTETLGIKYPIIQAPMSWITSAELVAAVSNAGGLGTLGAHAGQNTISDDPEEIGERLRKEIQKIKQLTSNQFGVNYHLLEDSQEDHPTINQTLKVCIEEGVKVIVAVGFPNEQSIKKLKELGFTVIFRESPSPSVTGSKAAEAAGADIIVATGFEAGGVTPSNPIGTMSIIPLIVDTVSIPVMASGGIVDKQKVNESFALGAEGVYLGTRFIVTKESPASEVTKQDIIKHRSEDLILINTSNGLFMRCTPHMLALQAKKLNSEGGSVEIGRQAFKVGLLDGKLDEGIVNISSEIDDINEIKTCKEIVDELMEDIIPVI